MNENTDFDREAYELDVEAETGAYRRRTEHRDGHSISVPGGKIEVAGTGHGAWLEVFSDTGQTKGAEDNEDEIDKVVIRSTN